MNDEQLSLLVQRFLQVGGKEKEQVVQQLALQINRLIQTDFERLVSILYRADVDEQKLKELLQQQPDTDAGLLIAGLLIQRQEEKEQLRRQYSRPQHDIPEDEKW